MCVCVYIHRFSLHDSEGHLVGLVQLMSTVHLALKARLLPDGIIRTKPGRDHPQHRGTRFREDERLIYRPSRAQERDKKEIFINQLHADVRKSCLEGKR